MNVWNDAKFVPYWGVFLIATACSLFIAMFLYLGWLQSTVLATNVTCHVKSSYPGSKVIHLDLNCDGHQVVIEEPTSLVYDVVDRHLKVITCESLYEDGSLQGCKYTGI